jgi:hypothetical protein
VDQTQFKCSIVRFTPRASLAAWRLPTRTSLASCQLRLWLSSSPLLCLPSPSSPPVAAGFEGFSKSSKAKAIVLELSTDFPEINWFVSSACWPPLRLRSRKGTTSLRYERPLVDSFFPKCILILARVNQALFRYALVLHPVCSFFYGMIALLLCALCPLVRSARRGSLFKDFSCR